MSTQDALKYGSSGSSKRLTGGCELRYFACVSGVCIFFQRENGLDKLSHSEEEYMRSKLDASIQHPKAFMKTCTCMQTCRETHAEAQKLYQEWKSKYDRMDEQMAALIRRSRHPTCDESTKLVCACACAYFFFLCSGTERARDRVRVSERWRQAS